MNECRASSVEELQQRLRSPTRPRVYGHLSESSLERIGIEAEAVEHRDVNVDRINRIGDGIATPAGSSPPLSARTAGRN